MTKIISIILISLCLLLLVTKQNKTSTKDVKRYFYTLELSENKNSLLVFVDNIKKLLLQKIIIKGESI